MKIAISGASGLVGKAVASLLEAKGHEIWRLVRRPVQSGEKAIEWDPKGGVPDSGPLNGFDAVIHLAGENLGEGRWTGDKKREVWESRVSGTKVLTDALCKLSSPPARFICASAIGFYGDGGERVLTEEDGPGTGYLAELCQAWEAATAPAVAAGISVVNLRTGVVLSSKGGALPRMLPPFRFGLGGVIGSGRQYMSWISLPDVAGAIVFLLEKPDMSGAVNFVAPQPVTNREFTKTLGKVLHRPTIAPLPGFAARLAFGKEKANELLLVSARIVPRKLESLGYKFIHPTLQEALESETR